MNSITTNQLRACLRAAADYLSGTNDVTDALEIACDRCSAEFDAELVDVVDMLIHFGLAARGSAK